MRGWHVDLLSRSDDPAKAAVDTDVLVIATPDDAIGDVAASVEPCEATLVVHMSGALAPGVLGHHPRRAGLHPLVSIPDADVGTVRLLGGCTFATAGDAGVLEIVALLGGKAIEIHDEQRVRYHAAACVAANHLVVLTGQVERLAQQVGVPADAYWDLMETTLENVRQLGSARSLTGPAARGDTETIARHLAALDARARPLYELLSKEAAAWT